MNKNTVILEFALASNGLLFVLLGYLIKYKKKAALLSGYQEDQVKNKDGLTNWTGEILIIMGLISLLLVLGIYYFPAHQILLMNTYIGVIVIGCIVLVIGSNRYKIKI